MENVYKKFFQMKYYGGWSLFEWYGLPVQLRDAFYEELLETKEREKEQAEKDN